MNKNTGSPTAKDEIEIAILVKTVKQNRLLLMAIIIMLSLLGYYYGTSKEPVYISEAVIQIPSYDAYLGIGQTPTSFLVYSVSDGVLGPVLKSIPEVEATASAARKLGLFTATPYSDATIVKLATKATKPRLSQRMLSAWKEEIINGFYQLIQKQAERNAELAGKVASSLRSDMVRELEIKANLPESRLAAQLALFGDNATSYVSLLAKKNHIISMQDTLREQFEVKQLMNPSLPTTSQTGSPFIPAVIGAVLGFGLSSIIVLALALGRG